MGPWGEAFGVGKEAWWCHRGAMTPEAVGKNHPLAWEVRLAWVRQWHRAAAAWVRGEPRVPAGVAWVLALEPPSWAWGAGEHPDWAWAGPFPAAVAWEPEAAREVELGPGPEAVPRRQVFQ